MYMLHSFILLKGSLFMYVCVCERACACMYVCMYLYVFIYVYVCTYIHMCVRKNVCMYSIFIIHTFRHAYSKSFFLPNWATHR